MKKIQDIIDIIGKKRFVTLVSVGVVAAVLGALWQQVLLPKSESIEREARTYESDYSRLQSEMIDLPARYKKLQEDEIQYDALIQSSFISSQDRLVARDTMQIIRAESPLNSMTYSIEPIQKVTDQGTSELHGELVRSKIAIEMKGLDDLQMRQFILDLQRRFGGLILLRTASFSLENDLTPQNVQTLNEGTAVDFVSGKADFDWYSVIPGTLNATPVTPASSGPGIQGLGLPHIGGIQ